ncbi:phosphatidylinositol 3-kinase catalytic subunit type 3-like isoform X2 [Tubulanus polymorphus]|uniref:phosphatidylinositol 3-kinase catalytic subunit type 3-like isoform X2 n=1 Tax=Tubulanus polymorphus TaxID=672921 RepID=UPI003DA266FF
MDGTDHIPQHRFCYVYSSDLDVNIQIKIGTLEGTRQRPSYKDLMDDPMLKFSGLYQERNADLYVTCQIFADNKPIALPVRTAYKPFTSRWNWNEWLTLPVKYSDLPRNALLALTIWDIYGTTEALPIGGTTVSLYGKYGTFRRGMIDLKVWPDMEADPNNASTTAGKGAGAKDQMSQLAHLTKRHHNGHMMKVDWLDRLTFREIELINEKQKRDSNFMYLMVEFPRIHCDGVEYAVVYFEKDGDDVYQMRTHAELVLVPDPEIDLNLVESKHHKLVRSLRSGPTDRDLKPNAATRDQLNVIVNYPPTKNLTTEEQDLVWKFRFYLSTQKKALIKFLKSVNWTVQQEVNQALELLYKWIPMDVEDALELLSPHFTHKAVRKYAVARLRQADDEDLLLYLLQLVQGLRYEDFDEIKSGLDSAFAARKESILPENIAPTVINQEKDNNPRRASNLSINESDPETAGTDSASLSSTEDTGKQMENDMDLATFLIQRACNNSTLANYFYWYVKVESDDQEKDAKVTDMYITVLKRFSQVLMKGGLEYRQRRSLIVKQQGFMSKLVELVKMVARESGNRRKKIERLQALLADNEAMNFANYDILPLPLDPEVKTIAIVPEKATLFNSALMPCRLTFRTINDQEYMAIFKHGDDLRQDQLILQIITLMDKLLRKENLDLKLTPYKVLATSNRHGFVQYVDALAIAEILRTDTSIQNYFRKHSPSENGPYGIAPEVMDNYVKSCAGYCVITYLLGVGDRHLDNLLLHKSGRLCHVDFGFILGRDPKPLPPPMKLSKEMVDAMGGTNSEHFHEFKKLSYTAFLHLRRSANLILNLFSLMVDANVPDIALEPDKTVKKVQDKFMLDLTDEEAVHCMQNLIDVSVSAMMAALVEQMHKIAQYWRK